MSLYTPERPGLETGESLPPELVALRERIRGLPREVRDELEPLIDGAVAYAASRGAPAVESYPVDPGAERIDLTMAFVGTRAMFEKAGFAVAGTTGAVAGGLPRLVMRRTLRPAG